MIGRKDGALLRQGEGEMIARMPRRLDGGERETVRPMLAEREDLDARRRERAAQLDLGVGRALTDHSLVGEAQRRLQQDLGIDESP